MLIEDESDGNAASSAKRKPRNYNHAPAWLRSRKKTKIERDEYKRADSRRLQRRCNLEEKNREKYAGRDIMHRARRGFRPTLLSRLRSQLTVSLPLSLSGRGENFSVTQKGLIEAVGIIIFARAHKVDCFLLRGLIITHARDRRPLSRMGDFYGRF